jgi:hypothetical protein
MTIVCLSLCGPLIAAGCSKAATPQGDRLHGLVYHDKDGDTVRGPREKGLARVMVSNGRDVVQTDVRGRWLLPVDGPREPFVIAPQGWRQSTNTEPDLIALRKWTASTNPTVHVGALVKSVPTVDLAIDFSADAPLLLNRPMGTPLSLNIGAMHVVVLPAELNADAKTFLQQDLLLAGSGRPLLILHEGPQGSLVLQDVPTQFTVLMSFEQAPFAVTLVDGDGLHVHFAQSSP